MAISPEKPEYLSRMQEKSKSEFTLLYDAGYKIANQFKLSFKPTDEQLILYNNLVKDNNLKTVHKDSGEQLPIPATYVVKPDGQIIWRHFDPNYRKRSSVSEIVMVLNKIM